MYYFIVNVYSLIFFLVISSVYSQSQLPDTSRGPGIAGCNCYGKLKLACNVPEVPIENFPTECTSLLYDGFTVHLDNEIGENGGSDSSTEGYLDKLIGTGCKVLIYYSHGSEEEWQQALSDNITENSTVETKASAEMESLKNLLDVHKGIQGIILVNLDINAGSIEFPEYTVNLKKYIDIMRTTLPDLAIGMNIIAKPAIQYYNDPKIDWLDFRVLDPSIDFYVVNLVGLNDCSDEFIDTGAFPLTGNSNFTLDIARQYLEDAGIPTSKLHYKYVTYGSFLKPSVNSFCSASYPFICCTNSRENNSALCADTQESLYDKGKYAQENGAGFITATIDLDDADGVCNCGRSFPAFYALLDGYNGAPPPSPCALFDRT